MDTDGHGWGSTDRQSRAGALLECGSLTPAFQRVDSPGRLSQAVPSGLPKRNSEFRTPCPPFASIGVHSRFTSSRFGRIVDQRWLKTSSGDPTDRFTYHYDRASSRTFRNNLVDAAFGELYQKNGALVQNAYDPLSRLIAFKRGELTASGNNGAILDEVDSPSREQDWDLDQLGNWDEIETDSAAQDRDHNAQNEITSISGSGVVQPAYDHNGNTTKFPAAIKDDFGVEVRAVYDAWNRLVRLVDDNDDTLAEYQYDALHRRIVRKEFDGGTLDATYHDYFTPAWQLAEVRQDGLSGDGVLEQYVWDAAPSGYIDCLVLRDRDTDDNGSLDERHYAQQDAIYNVSSVLDTSGDVQERYLFDPYGTRSFLDPDFDPRTATNFAWRVGSQGLVHDPDGPGAGLVYTRFRFRHPALGRWVTRDPLGYVDSGLLYLLQLGSPCVNFDPSGLQIDLLPRIPGCPDGMRRIRPAPDACRDVDRDYSRLWNLAMGLFENQRLLQDLDAGLQSWDQILREYQGAKEGFQQAYAELRRRIQTYTELREDMVLTQEYFQIRDEIESLISPANYVRDALGLRRSVLDGTVEDFLSKKLEVKLKEALFKDLDRRFITTLQAEAETYARAIIRDRDITFRRSLQRLNAAENTVALVKLQKGLLREMEVTLIEWIECCCEKM